MFNDFFDSLSEISDNWKSYWKQFLIVLLLGLFHAFLTVLLYKLFMYSNGILMSSILLFSFLIWLFCSVTCLLFPFSKIVRGFIIELKIPLF